MRKIVIAFIFTMFCVNITYAQVNPDALSLKERQVAAISGSAAKGETEGLSAALNAGLDAGLTVNEIKEVLVQLYAYCGFPRSMAALTTFMNVLDKRKALGIIDE